MQFRLTLPSTLFLLTMLLSRTGRDRLCWAQECDSAGRCDTHERCPVWKEEGECIRNREYMDKYCPVSCSDAPSKNEIARQASSTKGCKDIHARCPVWADLGECSSNPEMLKYCALSCDSCSEGGDDEDELCVDTHEKCSFWASSGECTNNPNWMLQNCAKSCNSCEKSKTKLHSETERKLSSSSKSPEDIMQLSVDFGERQKAAGNEAAQTLDIIEATSEYMKTEDYTSLPSNVRETCLNRHELCSFWAYLGAFMVRLVHGHRGNCICTVVLIFLFVLCFRGVRRQQILHANQLCACLQDLSSN